MTLAAVSDESRCFAFIFPMASGHINPSLPLARALVRLGHRVHYLSREQMRTAIEDTGAIFHSDIDHLTELYTNRVPDLVGAAESLKKEYGCESDSLIESIFKFRAVSLELKLPGTIRWLRSICANVVVFCPLLHLEAAYGGQLLGIPSVGLLTTAGPGSILRMLEEFLFSSGITKDQLRSKVESFEPHCAAVGRLNECYGLDVPLLMNMNPFGKYDVFAKSSFTLVTTCEYLQDPLTPDFAESYSKDGAVFVAVGALLDDEGTVRAAGHKYADGAAEPVENHTECSSKDVVKQVAEARAAGRQTILLSMGTVITGDHPVMGWHGRNQDEHGRPRGLTGRELCHGAWGGAFDAFGEPVANAGPLIVVSLGPQPDALEGLEVPANAVCMPVVPQVDVLRAGIDFFLTHGGQNSFTEALSTATPVVVCPGFGDQVVNARKADALGVGLQVPRPEPEAGGEAVALRRYRMDVVAALRRVAAEPSFAAEAASCAERLRCAGGVPRAVALLLEAAGASATQGSKNVQEGVQLERAQVASRTGGA